MNSILDLGRNVKHVAMKNTGYLMLENLLQFFQHFNWYSSHYQGADVDWKAYILSLKLLSNGT